MIRSIRTNSIATHPSNRAVVQYASSPPISQPASVPQSDNNSCKVRELCKLAPRGEHHALDHGRRSVPKVSRDSQQVRPCVDVSYRQGDDRSSHEITINATSSLHDWAAPSQESGQRAAPSKLTSSIPPKHTSAYS